VLLFAFCRAHSLYSAVGAREKTAKKNEGRAAMENTNNLGGFPNTYY
jgi:hypothetical protein